MSVLQYEPKSGKRVVVNETHAYLNMALPSEAVAREYVETAGYVAACVDRLSVSPLPHAALNIIVRPH